MNNKKKFIFPENIDSIGDLAFCGCVNLESLKFPTNLKHIGYAAFDGCTSLTNYNDIPENWKYYEV